MNRKILTLAIPNIISNITVPLLGMVDLIIVGQLGDYRYIGAIAIATSIFNLIYWNFGFLRMGTTGFTAQAYGARNKKECSHILARGLVVSLTIAILIIIAQKPLSWAALKILNGEGESAALALDYFKVRVWAAPATLSLYVTKGWFIGMQNSKIPMTIAISMNVINIVASYILAIFCGMGISGVALGTLIAQYSGLVISLCIIFVYYHELLLKIDFKQILSSSKMARFFSLNVDIFLRTISLSVVFAFFTSASSSMGEQMLAVNTLLLQLFTLFSYFMDGFAYAAEALVGRYVGAENRVMVRRSVRNILVWGLYISLPFTLLYLFVLPQILSIFTHEDIIISRALEYKYFIASVPLISFLAFVYDGILIGATKSVLMRNAMFVATALFFSLYYGLLSYSAEMALWVAFLVYLLTRGVVQALYFKVK